MVKLLAYARHELLDRTPPPTGAPDVRLLLEGSWRPGGTTAAPGGTGGLTASVALRQSLDETIDARFDWIDQQAADFAEQFGGADPERFRRQHVTLCANSPAYLNALALRYYLVKLIRPLAYLCDVQSLGPGD